MDRNSYSEEGVSPGNGGVSEREKGVVTGESEGVESGLGKHTTIAEEVDSTYDLFSLAKHYGKHGGPLRFVPFLPTYDMNWSSVLRKVMSRCQCRMKNGVDIN